MGIFPWPLFSCSVWILCQWNKRPKRCFFSFETMLRTLISSAPLKKMSGVAMLSTYFFE